MEEIEQNIKRRRKGVRHDADYKRNFVPKCKVKGAEHINYRNKTIPPKSWAAVSCR